MFFVLNNKKIRGANGKRYLPCTPSIANSVLRVHPSNIDDEIAINIKKESVPKKHFIFFVGINESSSDFLAVYKRIKRNKRIKNQGVLSSG